MSEQTQEQGPEVRMSPGGGEIVTRWARGHAWQRSGGTDDGELVEDSEVEGWTVLVAEQQRQEAVSGEALAVLVGPVDSQPHGAVQAELRLIQVSVRGQLDGIRPIEAVVLTYRWVAEHPHWVFEEFETLVQGLDGALKPGTALSAHDVAMMGSVVPWAWNLVERHRPRG